jgi:hypothetical protein
VTAVLLGAVRFLTGRISHEFFIGIMSTAVVALGGLSGYFWSLQINQWQSGRFLRKVDPAAGRPEPDPGRETEGA